MKTVFKALKWIMGFVIIFAIIAGSQSSDEFGKGIAYFFGTIYFMIISGVVGDFIDHVKWNIERDEKRHDEMKDYYKEIILRQGEIIYELRRLNGDFREEENPYRL